MHPKLSIIVPIYNVEEYLSKCIESILAQTFKSFELILVNDGSTDKSLEICYKYKENDSRIKVISKKNGGVSSARNIGMEIARGEYIAFVDPDDDIKENMYQIMIDKAIETEVDIVVCSFNHVNLIDNITREQLLWKDTNKVIDKQEIENSIIKSLICGEVFGYGLYCVWNKIYKKELIKEYRIKFNEEMHYAEDARFNVNLIAKINNIIFIQNPLYNYYTRNRLSLTSNVREDMYKYILDDKNFNLNLCKKYEFTKLINEVIQKYITKTILYIINIVNSKITLSKKIKIISDIVNDIDFGQSILVYECPYKFYELIKKACIKKSPISLIILIKVLYGKEKINKLKEKVV